MTIEANLDFEISNAPHKAFVIDKFDIPWKEILDFSEKNWKSKASFLLVNKNCWVEKERMFKLAKNLMDLDLCCTPPFMTLRYSKTAKGVPISGISVDHGLPGGYVESYTFTGRSSCYPPVCMAIPCIWVHKLHKFDKKWLQENDPAYTNQERFFGFLLMLSEIAPMKHGIVDQDDVVCFMELHEAHKNSRFFSKFLPLLMRHSIQRGENSVILGKKGIYADDRDITIIKMDHYGDAILAKHAVAQLLGRLKSTRGPYNETRLNFILSPQAFEVLIPFVVDWINIHYGPEYMYIGETLVHEFWTNEGSISKMNGMTEQFIDKLKNFSPTHFAIDLRSYGETREIFKYLRTWDGQPLRVAAVEGGNIESHLDAILSPFLAKSGTSNAVEMQTLISHIPFWSVPRKENAARFGCYDNYFAKHPIIVNPSCTAPVKNMDTELLWGLIQWFESNEVSYYFAGDRCNMLRKNHNTLKHIAGLLENGKTINDFCVSVAKTNPSVYIGTDSGASHAIADYGIPVVTIMSNCVSWGSWMPVGPRVATIGQVGYNSSCQYIGGSRKMNNACYQAVSKCGGKCAKASVHTVLHACGQVLDSP